MSAVRAVVLDIGGVLERTPPTDHRADWERRLGLEPGGIDRRLGDVWIDGGLGRTTEQAVEAAVAERLGLDPDRLAEFMGGFWDEYLGTLDDELAAWFGALRPRYRTGILSNSFVGATEREEARYGFAALTDTIVYSHEVGLAKPDPAVYLLVCERLGVRPDETVFVDDRLPAVEAAEAVGMAGVVHSDTTRTIREVERLLAG
jgi:putative hydrolase of the HAD superfamily